MPNFFSIARPSWPSSQTETKQNFTFGFSLMILTQPPLLSSAWQFEHHGAQKCTTVRSGVLIAPRTFCSAGDGSTRGEAAARAANTQILKIHIFQKLLENAVRSRSGERTRLACTFRRLAETPHWRRNSSQCGRKFAMARRHRQHARRVRSPELTSAKKTPTMASRFRDSSYAEIFPEEFRGYPEKFRERRLII